MTTTTRLALALLLAATPVLTWPGYTQDLPDAFTRVPRAPSALGTLAPGVSAALQALYAGTQPVDGPRPDVSALLQPAPLLPRYQGVLQADHGAPVRRFRVVRADPSALARAAARNPDGVRLSLFPDVTFDLEPRRTRATPHALSWHGAANGDLRASISLTLGEGTAMATGVIGTRAYRVLPVDPGTWLILELEREPRVGCDLAQ